MAYTYHPGYGWWDDAVPSTIPGSTAWLAAREAARVAAAASASAAAAAVMEYKGVWNASTNTPALADGTGSVGDMYRITVGAARNLGSASITWLADSYAVLNAASVWEQLGGAGAGGALADGSITTPKLAAGAVTAAKVAADVATQAELDLVESNARPDVQTIAAGAAPAMVLTRAVTEGVGASTGARLLIANTVLSISGQQAGWFVHLFLKQDATGSRTFAIDGSFGAAVAVPINAAANAETIVTLYFKTATDVSVVKPGEQAVSSVAAKTGAVTLVKADVGLANVDNTADTAKPVSTAQQTALDAKAPLASPTFTGVITAPEFSASGLTGATQASRYVGATTSGAPVSGTFAIGDFIIDRTAKIWICTTAGTPGTWTQVGPTPTVGMFVTFTAGDWIFPPGAGATTSPSISTGQGHLLPVYIGKTVAVDRLGAKCDVVGTSCTARLGVYADDGAGKPGALLLDAGTVDGTTTGLKTSGAVSLSLTPGVYWFCLQDEHSAGSPQWTGVSLPLPFIGRIDQSGSAYGWRILNTGALLATGATATRYAFAQCAASARVA